MPEIGEIRLGRYRPHRNKQIWHACIDCSKERWVRLLRKKPENPRCGSCASLLNHKGIGKNHPAWKGGEKRINGGYILVWIHPDDFFYPMANKSGYVLEHRLIVAKTLGRCLLPWEVVHHKGGCAKDDNQYPETLELLPNQYQHDALTKMENYIKAQEKEIRLLKWQVQELNRKIREIEILKRIA